MSRSGVHAHLRSCTELRALPDRLQRSQLHSRGQIHASLQKALLIRDHKAKEVYSFYHFQRSGERRVQRGTPSPATPSGESSSSKHRRTPKALTQPNKARLATGSFSPSLQFNTRAARFAPGNSALTSVPPRYPRPLTRSPMLLCIGH